MSRYFQHIFMTATALICLNGCSQPPKTENPGSSNSAASNPTKSALSSRSRQIASAASSLSGPEGGDSEDQDSRPASEESLMTDDLEALTSPPPTDGNNPIAYEAASTTSRAFTGNIRLIPVPNNHGDVTKTPTLFLESDLGLKYKLVLVHNGGVDAMDVLDWKDLLNSSVNMKDYIRRKSDTLDNLVFVYRVVEQTVSKKAFNGDLCGPKTGYIAFSVPFPGSRTHAYDGLLSMAAFKPGPWPPKDSSTLCGTFGYGQIH